MKENKSEFLIVVTLTVFAMATRILFNKLGFFNFNAVMATALFAGAYLSKQKFAVIIPVVALFATDLYLGLYDWKLMGVVYLAFGLVIFFGQHYRENPTLLRWVTSVLGGSLSFFLLTNFAVWLFGDGTFYTHTVEGLTKCFTMALPFYRNTILGDFTFSAVLFGAVELARLRFGARETVVA